VFWNIALDVLMVSLLAACIVTTVILNRRLTGLRGDSAELEKLARMFQEATDRADHGVSGLKLSAQSLQERIDQARSLVDDLQFLLERGGSLADRLEDGVRAAKRADVRPKPAQAPGGAEPARVRPARSNGQPRSAAELHLLAAMRAHG
jgi:hypothetical protein